ncbi:unnamed protein product [Parnassius mnemosyne]|uniref:DUF4806 domain-containing protein n=1 Tax=Parnassius mnemosyne TaxID=213953 RepID=A0AAV1K830_9NEOP
MNFKIVATVENGERKLIIVPCLWETNGELRCPKERADIIRLVKDKNSRPLPDWRITECVVKLSSIPSYEQAEKELRNMRQHRDADVNSRREEHVVNHQERTPNSVTATANPTSIPLVTTLTVENINEHEFEYIDCKNNLPTTSVQTQEITNTNHVMEYLKVISDSQYNMAQTLNLVVDNQKKLFHKLANLSVQIKDVNSKRDQINKTPITLSESTATERDGFIIKPIESVRELEEMESMLSDNTHKCKLMQQYSLVCSQSEGKGVTCAYKMLDLFFSREFLCKCSWTGGSRSDELKIGFKGYKNILQFYFELINSWDSTYTMQDNENFFKVILKNSAKRKLHKNIRASTKRTRAKKAVIVKKHQNQIEGNHAVSQHELEISESQQRNETRQQIFAGQE